MNVAMGPEEKLVQAESDLHERRLAIALSGLSEAEILGADPDRCSAGRWLAQMLLGNFEAAWRESDLIRERETPDPHRFWLGEGLENKRVILRCLHGLGDSIQFFRYLPRLGALAKKLTVEVPPPMLELAPFFDGMGRVVTWGKKAPLIPARWNVQIEVNELPYIFRTQSSELPIAERYLRLPKDVLQPNELQRSDSGSIRVGVVWSSGHWNPSRSVPFDLLRRITNAPGCEFWNLQGGEARQQWSQLGPARHLHAAESCADSLLKLAAYAEQMDLVITPDTLAAHLAGALGVPAWVMLEHAADWRWQHGRSDSPWYRSLRLFRQPRAGDWHSVVHAVEAALHRQASSSHHERLVA